MKNIKVIYNLSLVLAAGIFLTGCKVDEPMLPDYGEREPMLYMPQAAKNPFLNVLLMSDQIQEVAFGAAYGGLDYPDTDIPVTFKVTTEQIAAYNEQNNTSYIQLPAGAYELSGTTAVIRKGETSSNALKVKVKTLGEIDPFKDYILPITMESSMSSVKVNEKLSTAYLIIRASPDLADYEDFERTNWTVYDLSSEEASGEGPNNGRGIYAIDNDPATYWHSVWSSGETDPPHHISFDMGETKVVHGIYIVHRNGNPQAKTIVVEGSMDGTNWTERGTFTNIPTNSTGGIKHRSFVTSFEEARYIKVVVIENARRSTNIAEIGAF